jgi:hypothetical protein
MSLKTKNEQLPKQESIHYEHSDSVEEFKAKLERLKKVFEGNRNQSQREQKWNKEQANAIGIILRNQLLLERLRLNRIFDNLEQKKSSTDYADFLSKNQIETSENDEDNLKLLLAQLGGRKTKYQFSPPDSRPANEDSNGNYEFSDSLNQLEQVIIIAIKEFIESLKQESIEFKHWIGALDTTKPKNSEDLSRLNYHLITFDKNSTSFGVMTNFGKNSFIYFLRAETLKEIKTASQLTKNELSESDHQYAQISVNDLNTSLFTLLNDADSIEWRNVIIEEGEVEMTNLNNNTLTLETKHSGKKKNERKTPKETIGIITPFIDWMIINKKKLSSAKFKTEYQILKNYFDGEQYKYLSSIKGIEEARTIWYDTKQKQNEKRTPDQIISALTPSLVWIIANKKRISRAENEVGYRILQKYFDKGQYKYLDSISQIEEAREIWHETKQERNGIKTPQEVVNIVTPLIDWMNENKQRISKNGFEIGYVILKNYFHNDQYKYLSELPNIEEARKIWEKEK